MPRVDFHPANYQRRPAALRRGITLVELLIVITIMMMMMALAARRIKPAVDARRVREGARMLSVYLSAARNRRGDAAELRVTAPVTVKGIPQWR